MITTRVNRYAIQPAVDLSGFMRCTIKYCELCRLPFVTDSDQARNPGDYISLQRGAGRRTPITCNKCSSATAQLAAAVAEMKQMSDTVKSLRIKRDADEELRRQIRIEQYSKQGSSAIRHSAQENARARDASRYKARRTWASWRLPLMNALRDMQELDAKQIAAIMHMSYDVQKAPARARAAGIPLVVARVAMIPGKRRNRFYPVRMYGLSSNPDPTPLTPPQDPETKQFMREVQ